jgi:hypothetical protein
MIKKYRLSSQETMVIEFPEKRDEAENKANIHEAARSVIF